jgi:hypothetical protein
MKAKYLPGYHLCTGTSWKPKLSAYAANEGKWPSENTLPLVTLTSVMLLVFGTVFLSSAMIHTDQMYSEWEVVCG